MKKDTHNQQREVNFTCAACNKSYLLKSSLKEDSYSLDVCSNCHPFYVGKSSTLQVKGRAEHFNKKVEATAKAQSEKTQPTKKDQPKSNKKIIKSLSGL